jgi:hypothetical protein
MAPDALDTDQQRIRDELRGSELVLIAEAHLSLTVEAMRAEGLPHDVIDRVVNRLVYGTPEDVGTNLLMYGTREAPPPKAATLALPPFGEPGVSMVWMSDTPASPKEA